MARRQRFGCLDTWLCSCKQTLSLRFPIAFQLQASGKMRSTPLLVKEKVSSFTKLRTSKVMYMNEMKYPVANNLSQRLNLALKLNVTSKFGSENYQVMNYGLGGTIITHLDSTGSFSLSILLDGATWK